MVDNVNRQKAVATLSAIYRAVLAAPSTADIPNIEFVFSVEDLPAQPHKPIWSLTRRVPCRINGLRRRGDGHRHGDKPLQRLLGSACFTTTWSIAG